MAVLTLDSLQVLDASSPERQNAFRQFENLPVPGPTDEAWRYVDRTIDLESVALVSVAGDRMPADEILAALEPSQRLVIVDGKAVEMAGEGFGIESTKLLDLVSPDTDKLAAAHRAFVDAGVSVSLPRGKSTTAPVLIEVQTTASKTISFPHVTIEIGEDAEAEVIIAYRSRDGAQAISVPQVEIDIAQSGRLRLLALQEMALDSTIVVQLRARLGRDATLRLGEVGLGGDLARLDMAVDLDGQGSSSDIVGVFFGHREQVLDYRMVLNHRGPKSSSNVLLKGAVEDASQSVFSGLVRIEKPAIGTTAFETNRNLVLSPDAKANSIPNLEILCDDVICGHGSSVGPLEEEHLYYLGSRGIAPQRAERLLVRGFFQEVLDQLPVSGMEVALAEILERRFIRGQQMAADL
ncbi:MAG TPA: Fe-S cluster assembly protein SufD [Acidimicrobiia bacterium]|nr:Fe-S cluster assembly protein SufD [Acidimicrobiia bacterium]